MNERRCIVTRQTHPREELLRFVAGPDGVIVPDLKNRLPGRGAWVVSTRETVDLAVRRKAFSRALTGPIVVDPALADQVAALLADRALGALGLAARAGAVATGMAKVDRATRRGELALVLNACDGAPDGRRKIAAACTAAGENAPRISEIFTVEQLSLALGRPNVVHAGVVAGRATASLEAAVRRFERYCSGGASDARAA